MLSATLKTLHIESNLFSTLPCSFGRLNLREFSLDWFKYLNSEQPLPQIISTDLEEG